MRTHRLVSVALLLIVLSSTAPRTAAPDAAPPHGDGPVKLVLLIAVDQFRYDYLTRFRTEYNAGFNRLLTDGADFTNAFLEHYPTVTAVGHSTMMSGATPSVSGIVGNDWYDRSLGKSVTSVDDPDTQLVGGNGAGSSPHRMLVDTVGDELKSASRAPAGSEQAPKVFGLSLKDRAAVLPAGHMANAAFWLDTTAGNFVTSTYYRKDLPPWVADFNAKKMPDSYAGKAWTYLDPSAGARTHAAAARAGALRRRLRQPVRQRSARSVRGSRASGREARAARSHRHPDGELLVERRRRPRLRPRQPRGARHRRADGSRHRAAAGACGCPRRPRPHHRRADG